MVAKVHYIVSNVTASAVALEASLPHSVFDLNLMATDGDVDDLLTTKENSLASEVVGLEVSPATGMLGISLLMGAIARITTGRLRGVVVFNSKGMTVDSLLHIPTTDPTDTASLRSAIDAQRVVIASSVVDLVAGAERLVGNVNWN